MHTHVDSSSEPGNKVRMCIDVSVCFLRIYCVCTSSPNCCLLLRGEACPSIHLVPRLPWQGSILVGHPWKLCALLSTINGAIGEFTNHARDGNGVCDVSYKHLFNAAFNANILEYDFKIVLLKCHFVLYPCKGHSLVGLATFTSLCYCHHKLLLEDFLS